MGDPLAGFDMGPDDIFYEGGPPPKPVITRNDEHESRQNQHPMHQNVDGDLSARVARLEEQVRRLLNLVALG